MAADTFECLVESTEECSAGIQENLHGRLDHIVEFMDQCDPCNPDPCINGGTCHVDEDYDYQCLCPDGYTGDHCETGELTLEALNLFMKTLGGQRVFSI